MSNFLLSLKDFYEDLYVLVRQSDVEVVDFVDKIYPLTLNKCSELIHFSETPVVSLLRPERLHLLIF